MLPKGKTMKGSTVIFTEFLAILGLSLCLVLSGCGKKEQSAKTVVNKPAEQAKVDPVEDVNKHLEALLQYYHSNENPLNTPVRVCYDPTSKIYFLKFATNVTYKYKDEDGNPKEDYYHFSGWNSVYEKDVTFVTIGNGSLTVTNAPDTTKNISASLDGLTCMNFSQITKVWDNQ